MNNALVLDADYVCEDDAALVREHMERMERQHHQDEAQAGELAARMRGARAYIRRSVRRTRAGERRRTAFVWRLLAGSALLFGWAVVMALLVGCGIG